MLHPVILAGGSGTRLWPVSRKSYPKQFAPLTGPGSLYQQTLRRLSGPCYAPPLVVTGEDYRFIATEQAEEAGTDEFTLLVEPHARNTAAAVLSAALSMQETPDAVMLIVPSDHMITDHSAFEAAMQTGEQLAIDGEIVVFGVQPDCPATGFGYLDTGEGVRDGEVLDVCKFTEKPNAETAIAMLESGRYLWNAGMFMCRAGVLLDAFFEHAPNLVQPCETALTWSKQDLNFLRLDGAAYGQCENISFDYAVMEKLKTCKAVKLDCGWSDLGTWAAVKDAGTGDEDGNTLSGNAISIGCSNSLLKSENPETAIVGMGLKDIVAIATDDAILVADLEHSDQIGQTVEILRAHNASQAEEFRRCHRPWGYYETLSLGHRFQVKRIMVKPGAQLSLQSHVHRAEHWVVVEGSARVTVGDQVQLLTENQSTYIPLGEIHRLENPGKLPLHLIEVQSGGYLGEDDIKRYEDIYNRTEEVA